MDDFLLDQIIDDMELSMYEGPGECNRGGYFVSYNDHREPVELIALKLHETKSAILVEYDDHIHFPRPEWFPKSKIKILETMQNGKLKFECEEWILDIKDKQIRKNSKASKTVYYLKCRECDCRCESKIHLPMNAIQSELRNIKICPREKWPAQWFPVKIEEQINYGWNENDCKFFENEKHSNYCYCKQVIAENGDWRGECPLETEKERSMFCKYFEKLSAAESNDKQ